MSESLFDSAESTEDEQNASVDNTTIENDSNKTPATEAETTEDNSNEWYLTDGVKGEGDAPEFFDSKKYKSIAEQAKAYPEARKHISKLTNKLGSFTGAPEIYDLNLGEEYPNLVGSDDELITNFIDSSSKVAKELNMNQEGFSKLAKNFASYISETNQKVHEYQKKQIEELGPNAREEMTGIINWAKQSSHEVSDEDIAELKNMMSSARSVKLLQKLRGAKPAIGISQLGPEEQYSTKQDLKGMLSDKRYGRDRDFTKIVDDKYKKFYSN